GTGGPGGVGGTGGSGGSGGSGGAGGFGGTGGGAPWVNPGCTASPRVVQRELQLGARVDLSTYQDRMYRREGTISVRPDQPGDAISLYGTLMLLGEASVGYAYDGNVVTFCTGPYQAGDVVTVDVKYVISEQHQNFPPGSIAGLRVWGDET